MSGAPVLTLVAMQVRRARRRFGTDSRILVQTCRVDPLVRNGGCAAKDRCTALLSQQAWSQPGGKCKRRREGDDDVFRPAQPLDSSQPVVDRRAGTHQGLVWHPETLRLGGVVAARRAQLARATPPVTAEVPICCRAIGLSGWGFRSRLRARAPPDRPPCDDDGYRGGRLVESGLQAYRMQRIDLGRGRTGSAAGRTAASGRRRRSAPDAEVPLSHSPVRAPRVQALQEAGLEQRVRLRPRSWRRQKQSANSVDSGAARGC